MDPLIHLAAIDPDMASALMGPKADPFKLIAEQGMNEHKARVATGDWIVVSPGDYRDSYFSDSVDRLGGWTPIRSEALRYTEAEARVVAAELNAKRDWVKNIHAIFDGPGGK